MNFCPQNRTKWKGWTNKPIIHFLEPDQKLEMTRKNSCQEIVYVKGGLMADLQNMVMLSRTKLDLMKPANYIPDNQIRKSKEDTELQDHQKTFSNSKTPEVNNTNIQKNGYQTVGF